MAFQDCGFRCLAAMAAERVLFVKIPAKRWHSFYLEVAHLFLFYLYQAMVVSKTKEKFTTSPGLEVAEYGSVL